MVADRPAVVGSSVVVVVERPICRRCRRVSGEARGVSAATRSVVDGPTIGRRRTPRRRLVTVVEMPGVFSVISSFSLSTTAGALDVVDGVGRVRLANGDGLREGLSASSFTIAFGVGVTTILRDGINLAGLDLRVEASFTASLTASGRLTVDVRKRPGRVGRDRPGMKVLLVLTSETTTFRVVSLDSVVDCGELARLLSVLRNLRWPGVVVSTSAVLTLYTVVYSVTVVSVRSDVGKSRSVAISLTSSARRLSIVSCVRLRTAVGRSCAIFVIGVSTTVPLVIFGSLS